MRLILLHGRKTPDEVMDGWGFAGPVLEEVEYLHVTYQTTFTVGFTTEKAACKAHEQTGWPWWDAAVLEMAFHDDLVQAGGAYYGDWELQAAPPSPRPPRCDSIPIQGGLMPPTRDIARYDYPGYGGCASQCRLRLWQRERATVVMVTERDDNPGTSVTNVIETLAMQICREFELWPSLTRWIEHYPPSGPFPEGFSEVTFALDPQAGLTRPRWHPRSRAEVEDLIGEPLPGPGEELPGPPTAETPAGWRTRLERRAAGQRSP